MTSFFGKIIDKITDVLVRELYKENDKKIKKVLEEEEQNATR